MKNAMQYTERIKLVPHATWVDTSKLHDALECVRHGDASVIYTTPTLLTTRCHVNDPRYPILMTSFDVTDMQCLLNEPGKMMAAVPMSTALAECTAMLVLGTQDQPEKPEGMEQAKWELQLYDEMVKDIDVKTMGTWLETTRGYRYMFAITDEPPLTDAESKPETVKTIVVNRHPDMMNIDYSDISRSAVGFNRTDDPWVNIIQGNRYAIDPYMQVMVPLHGIIRIESLDEFRNDTRTPFLVRMAAGCSALSYHDIEYQALAGNDDDDVEYIGALKIIDSEILTTFKSANKYVHFILLESQT